MSSTPFTVTEHTVDCQYIREYPRATNTQDAPLKLLVKKYTPTDNQDPQPGDVTLVGAPGAGLCKELYEPLWEEIIARCQQDGFRIRAIWIADAANQGASGVHNEQYLGNDPSWFDNSRDMLHMINHFRDEMPRPIMAIGHSAGAVQQAALSLIHPRLFTSLILIEPFLHNGRPPSESRWIFARSKQKDTWPSRAEAVAQSKKLLAVWDPRVRERFVQHAYRELPTALYPETTTTIGIPSSAASDSRPVALTTPICQEVLAYARPNPRRHRELGAPEDQDDSSAYGPSPAHDPFAVPDMVGKLWKHQVMYRAEPTIAWRLLPHVRPSTLYVSGEMSALSQDGNQDIAVKRTGTGIGGSGGVECGRVQHAVIKKAGHTVPLEKVGETAEVVGKWISREVERWKEEEKRVEDGWSGLSARERIGFSDEFNRLMDFSAKMIPKRGPKSKI